MIYNQKVISHSCHMANDHFTSFLRAKYMSNQFSTVCKISLFMSHPAGSVHIKLAPACHLSCSFSLCHHGNQRISPLGPDLGLLTSIRTSCAAPELIASTGISRRRLGKTSKFITTGCSQNAAAFKSNVYHFLYKLAAAGC